MYANLVFISSGALAFASAAWLLYSTMSHQSKLKVRESLLTHTPHGYSSKNLTLSLNNSLELLDKSIEEEAKIYPKVLSINYGEAKSGHVNYEIEVNLRLTQYFDAICTYIKKAKSTIFILDYVEHGKEMDKSDDFFEAIKISYERYFSEIENIVTSNRAIRYVRILQLPVNTRLESNKDEAILKHMVNNLYGLTRKHIDTLIGEPNFELYVIPCAVRLHSEVVIDKSAWLVEIDSYDRDKRAKPDCLFIHQADEGSETARTIAVEYQKIEGIVKSHNPVSKEQLASIIRQMLEKSDALVADFPEALS